MRVAQVMSSPAASIGPQESLRRAAALMRELDVGALPVCHAGRLLGMVTDRDIATRGVGHGLTPDGACVSDVMSRTASHCRPGDDAASALRCMSEHRLRRLPVVGDDGKLMGIVALADIALRMAEGDADDAQLARALRSISQPTGTRLAAGGVGRSRSPAV